MKALLAFILLLTCCAAANPRLQHRPTKFYLIGLVEDDIVPYVQEYLASTAYPEIVISTPGGLRGASESIADAIAKHGNVRCVVRDQAMSGGFAILQACKIRVMHASARLGAHEPRLQIPVAIERTLAAKILENLEGASEEWNARCRARLRMTAAEYEAKVKGLDWVLTATEALRVGAVDQVVP